MVHAEQGKSAVAGDAVEPVEVGSGRRTVLDSGVAQFVLVVGVQVLRRGYSVVQQIAGIDVGLVHPHDHHPAGPGSQVDAQSRPARHAGVVVVVPVLSSRTHSAGIGVVVVVGSAVGAYDGSGD